MDIKELVEQFTTVNKELKSFQASQKTALEEAKSGSEEAKQKAVDLEQKLKEIEEKHEQALSDLSAKLSRPGAGESETKTLGQLFTSSDVYNSIKSTERGNNQPVSFDRKDISSLAASAGALIRPDRDPEVYRSIGGRRQLRIRDLVANIPISSGSVEIMRQVTAATEAGPQQSSTPNSNQGGGEFQAKNKSDLTWELVTKPVRTIAHWVPASRQALSDAPMLQSLIDTELTYGLQLESDDQILAGDGSNQNLEGILQDSEVNDVGEIASGTSSDDLPGAMIDHIRAAVTQCQLFEYYDMDGLVLNPVDWQTLETAKATDGHYLLVAFAATSAESPTVWRVPVVVSNAMPAGQFVIGNWRMGAQLYVREGVSVRVSESHEEFFVKNAVAVLAEERYCLGISRPKALCKGSFAVANGS